MMEFDELQNPIYSTYQNEINKRRDPDSTIIPTLKNYVEFKLTERIDTKKQQEDEKRIKLNKRKRESTFPWQAL